MKVPSGFWYVSATVVVLVALWLLFGLWLTQDRAEGQGYSRGPDIQMISFPYQQSVIYRDDQNYEAEHRLQRWYNSGYEIEAVIEPRQANGTPIVILKR